MKLKKTLITISILITILMIASLTFLPPGGVNKALAAATYGNATAGNLLSGYTATVDAGQITGTMPNNGRVILTPGTANQTIAAGYHNGSGYVIGDANLVSANIKAGASIFGVAGKSSVVDSGDASASAGQILSGYTAYVNGLKISGTMSNNGSPTWTPGTTNQSLAAGYYSGGIVRGDPNLVASNIVSGVSIFGVAGSAINGAGMRKFASGIVNSLYGALTINNLSFRPDYVIVIMTNPTSSNVTDIVILSDEFDLTSYGSGNVSTMEFIANSSAKYIYPGSTTTSPMTSNGFSYTPTYDNSTNNFKWIAFSH